MSGGQRLVRQVRQHLLVGGAVDGVGLDAGRERPKGELPKSVESSVAETPWVSCQFASMNLKLSP